MTCAHSAQLSLTRLNYKQSKQISLRDIYVLCRSLFSMKLIIPFWLFFFYTWHGWEKAMLCDIKKIPSE